MATRFEFVLVGENAVRLRAAGEEALEEIDRIESQLSLYRPGSEIAQINARASFKPVRVSPELFALLQRAKTISETTNGAFDITVAPLVRCWGFMKGSGSRPTDIQIAEARELVGAKHLELDEANSTVRFKRAGMMLDLSSLGKGYALDLAAEALRDAGVENALLHGGTSTIYALGRDAGEKWKVAIDRPALPGPQTSESAQSPPLVVVELEDEALSMSAVWGKFFNLDGRTYGHVIDPRTGWPSETALLGAIVVTSAADSDALSTAVLLGTEGELKALQKIFPGSRLLQATQEGQELRLRSYNIECRDS